MVVQEEEEYVIKATYIPNEIGSPRLVYIKSFPTVSKASLEYEVKFLKGFNFVRGGKLPGLGPSIPLTGCNDGDENKWSVRLMWLQDQKLGIYYYGQVRGTHCGDTIVAHGVRLEDDRWYKIRMDVYLNTAGEANARVDLYLDDILVSSPNTLELRGNTTSSSSLIQKLVFNTFYGGSDSSWSPPHPTQSIFKNIKVTEIK